jgi:hypothetical protein
MLRACVAACKEERRREEVKKMLVAKMQYQKTLAERAILGL